MGTRLHDSGSHPTTRTYSPASGTSAAQRSAAVKSLVDIIKARVVFILHSSENLSAANIFSTGPSGHFNFRIGARRARRALYPVHSQEPFVTVLFKGLKSRLPVEFSRVCLI